MPIYTLGPSILAAKTQYQYSVPPDLNNIIGFQIENYSVFDLTVQGIASTLAHLWPYTGCYYPVSFPTTGKFPLSFTSGVQQLIAPFEMVNSLQFGINIPIGVNVFLSGDIEPAPYMPYFLGGQQGIQGLMSKMQTSNTLPDSTSAHSTTFGGNQLNNLAGSGLYLTHLSVFFGAPSAAISEDCTLTDINGAIVQRYHLHMGVDPAPRGEIIINFTDPLPGGGILNNQQSLTFNNPATVNGPGYSVNMNGFTI